MSIEITIDAGQIEAALERLRGVPHALQRAVYPAVGEVMQGARNHLAQYLSSDVPLSPGSARKAIKLIQPRPAGGAVIGEIVVRSAMLPLIEYGVQPKEITARPGLHPRSWPDFTFSLRRGDRRAGRSRIQGAGLPFIARMKTGHLGVYFRTGGQSRKGRAQIKQSYGPSVQYHVATPEIAGLFAEQAGGRFPEVLARYVDQALAGHGGGA